jgi:hypothetical protein
MRAIGAAKELHPSDEVLELYALGHLPSAQVSPLEEHLLVCTGCQDRVTEIDAYVLDMKRICREVARLRDQEAERGMRSRILHLPLPAWAGAAAVLVLVAAVPLMRTPDGPVPDTDVRLVTNRGGAESAIRAEGNLRLEIATSQLIPFPAYRVSVVDGTGRELWLSEVRPHAADLSVRLPMRLDSGAYWVRVTGTNREPAGEFALRVR